MADPSAPDPRVIARGLTKAQRAFLRQADWHPDNEHSAADTYRPLQHLWGAGLMDCKRLQFGRIGGKITPLGRAVAAALKEMET